MTSEKDVYISAQVVIRKCGAKTNPVAYAFGRMSRLYNIGDDDGAIVWARIANAVEDLLIKNPPGTH